MKKRILFLILLIIFVLPALALAQYYRPSAPAASTIAGMIPTLKTLAWQVFGLIALMAFIIAGILFLTSGGAPDKLNTARNSLIWGVVGIVVGILAYSILTIMGTALGA